MMGAEDLCVELLSCCASGTAAQACGVRFLRGLFQEA